MKPQARNLVWKLLILSSLALSQLVIQAQPVPAYFTNLLFTGSTNDTTVNVTPPNNPILFNGITYWFPIGGTNVPSTNGVAGISLIPGRYTVSLAGVAKSWTLNVPNNGGVAINALNYSTNVVVYSGITSVVGVGGITVFGPTGGTVTVSNNPASSGVQSVQPTNTLLSSVIGSVLWSSTNFDVFGTAAGLFSTLGTASSNLSYAVGQANTNFALAQIGSLGTASSNYTQAQAGSLGTQSTNYTQAQIGSAGTASTNFALSIGANNTNYTQTQVGSLGAASTNYTQAQMAAAGSQATNFALSIGANNTNFTQSQTASLGAGVTNFTLQIGANNTNFTQSQIAGAGSAATNYANAIGNNLTNYVNSVPGLSGTAATNYANQIGANNTNFTSSQVGALGTASTNFASSIGANNTNYTQSQIATIGSQATNFASGIGANNTNYTQSQIGSLGTASTNYANSIGANLTNYANSLPAAGGAAATNYANQVGANNTNFTQTQVGALGTASTNFANAIGANNTNYTQSQIATAGSQATNFALGIGANNTNYTQTQIAGAGSAATNYANALGLNGSNNVSSQIATLGTQSTNFANSIGANNTNYTQSQIATAGSQATNFALSVGANNTNYTQSQIAAAGSAWTNFANNIGLNGSNNTAFQVATLGTNATNFALALGAAATNYANSVGAGATNLSATKVSTNGGVSWSQKLIQPVADAYILTNAAGTNIGVISMTNGSTLLINLGGPTNQLVIQSNGTAIIPLATFLQSFFTPLGQFATVQIGNHSFLTVLTNYIYVYNASLPIVGQGVYEFRPNLGFFTNIQNGISLTNVSGGFNFNSNGLTIYSLTGSSPLGTYNGANGSPGTVSTYYGARLDGDGILWSNLPASEIVGLLTNNTTGNAATATLAGNVVAGINLTNANLFGALNSTNFTGSFVGDGSQITNVNLNNALSTNVPLWLQLNSVGSANFKSNQLQFSAWQITNNEFATTWPFGTNNLWTFQHIGQTNVGEIYFNDPTLATEGIAITPVNLTQAARNVGFRFITQLKFQAGATPTGIAVAGIYTNAAGVITDDGAIAGWGLNTFNGPGFTGWRIPAGALFERPSWATATFQPGVNYTLCVGGDSSNYYASLIWPGHTNEVRAFIPWSLFSNLGSLTVSNLALLEVDGTNVAFGPTGGRTAPQTINPSTNVEGRSDFVVWSVDSHVSISNSTFGGDAIRISLPSQMDSGTNIPDLLILVHGTGGNYDDAYGEGIPGSGDQGQLPGLRDYFNALNSNNIMVASYLGDAVFPGHMDTYGTSNSLTCVDGLLQYVRARWPFRYLFIEGESAGGATAIDYAASHHEVKAVVLNHAIGGITNLYGAHKTDIDQAYGGGGTAAEFATSLQNGVYWGDPGGVPPSAFAGLSLFSVSSYGDNVVIKSNNTDVVIRMLGGQVGTSNAQPTFVAATNTAAGCPEVDDYGVNGTAGVHGGLCYSPAQTATELAFLSRVRAYAQMDAANRGGDIKTYGNSSVTGLFSAGNGSASFRTNAPTLNELPNSGMSMMWNSNGLSWTNSFFLGVNSNNSLLNYRMVFGP